MTFVYGPITGMTVLLGCLLMYNLLLDMVSLIDMKVERCFQGDQQLVNNVECFKGIHTVCQIICCHVMFHLSPLTIVAGSWQGFMLATAVTVRAIAGNVEVD